MDVWEIFITKKRTSSDSSFYGIQVKAVRVFNGGDLTINKKKISNEIYSAVVYKFWWYCKMSLHLIDWNFNGQPISCRTLEVQYLI